MFTHLERLHALVRAADRRAHPLEGDLHHRLLEAGTYETASTTPKRRTTAACLLTASGGACVAGGVDLGPIYGTASATPPFSSP